MKIRKEFIIGIVAATGIVALILGFFFLRGQEVWKERTTYYAVYERATGLNTGSRVDVLGVPVGTVVMVDLHPKDPSKTLVKFEVSREDIKIPKGSLAFLEFGMLGGTTITLKYSKAMEFHQDGDTLAVDVSKDLQEQINATLIPLHQKTEELISTADSTITTIRSIFSNNTDNLNESFEGIRRAILTFENVALNLDTTIKAFASSRYQVVQTLDNLNSITANLKKSNDMVTHTINNVAVITDSLKELELQTTLNEAQKSLEMVNLILDEIKYGDGTIQQLMQDSTLYNNMNVMIDEASRLVDNIKSHPNRYLQFAVFGSKDKGLRLDAKDERKLRRFVKDSLK